MTNLPRRLRYFAAARITGWRLVAYTWMIEQNIIGPDLPIDDMLAWWFDTEDGGCCEDFTTGCVIQEVNR